MTPLYKALEAKNALGVAADKFLSDVNNIAINLGVDPDWLMAVFYTETGGKFQASTKNPIGYVGLIQFSPATAAQLGTTTAALVAMTSDEQLGYVFNYLWYWENAFATNGQRFIPSNFTDLYSLIFYPASAPFGLDYEYGNSAASNALIKSQNPLISKYAPGVPMKKIHFKQFLKENHPQLFAGEDAKDQTIDQDVLAENTLLTGRDWYEVRVPNTTDDTLENIITELGLTDVTAETLIQFPDDGTITNYNIIRQTYLAFDPVSGISEILEYAAHPENLVHPGTIIKVPKKVKAPVELASSNYESNRSVIYSAFVADEISKVIRDPGYLPINDDAATLFTKYNPKATVFIFCKSIGTNGTLINVTKFISQLNTSVGGDGGSFSFNLPPINCNLDANGNIIAVQLLEHDNGYVAKGAQRKFSTNTQNFYFNRCISNNDVVFIKFSKLNMEALNYTDFDVPFSELANYVWDMIGLVDANSINMGYEQNTTTLSVSGSDLIKTVAMDSVVFYAQQYSTTNGVFYNSDPNSKSVIRLSDGKLYNVWFDYVDRTIDVCIRYLINQLSTIQVVSNDKLFDAVVNKTKTFLYEQENDGFTAIGIWRIIRLVMDESVKNRYVVDSSISTASGSILSMIRKLCQDPFVEFWGDTYGTNYYFIVRQPPFTYESYISNYTIDISNANIDSIFLDNDKRIYSWYHLNPTAFIDDLSLEFGLTKAVVLNEYMEIWGSRPLDVVSNYVTHSGYGNGTKADDFTLQRMIEVAESDLEFIIETNAYLPFTKAGTIVIRPGDRRIKKGMNIYHIETDMLFYVDAVSHMEISSGENTTYQTVLNVSRGMVKQYYDLYFNIVNLKKNANSASKSSTLKPFLNTNPQPLTLNKKVFNFFIQQQQYFNLQ